MKIPMSLVAVFLVLSSLLVSAALLASITTPYSRYQYPFWVFLSLSYNAESIHCRPRMPSFCRICFTWVSIVATEIPREFAMPRFVDPALIRLTISRSRLVSGSLVMTNLILRPGNIGAVRPIQRQGFNVGRSLCRMSYVCQIFNIDVLIIEHNNRKCYGTDTFMHELNTLSLSYRRGFQSRPGYERPTGQITGVGMA